jgi:hypothetical protein
MSPATFTTTFCRTKAPSGSTTTNPLCSTTSWTRDPTSTTIGADSTTVTTALKHPSLEQLLMLLAMHTVTFWARTPLANWWVTIRHSSISNSSKDPTGVPTSATNQTQTNPTMHPGQELLHPWVEMPRVTSSKTTLLTSWWLTIQVSSATT